MSYHRVKFYPVRGQFFHDPTQFKIDHLPNPDDPDKRSNLPLILQKAAHQVADMVVNDPHNKDIQFLTYRYSESRGRKVKIRSQKLEAMAKVIPTLFKYTSLAWGMVGYEDDDRQFHHYTDRWLASQAGVSESQYKRVSSWVRRKGVLITRKLCTMQEDGSYRGHAGLKHLTSAFMSVLGFDKWMDKERKKAKGRAQNKKDNPNTSPSEMSKKAKAVAKMAQDAAMREIQGYLGGSNKQNLLKIPTL